MKLQKKINLYFFSVSLIIFLLSSIISYFVLKDLVLEEVDETLEAEKNNLVIQLNKFNNPENLLENHSYRLEVFPIKNETIFNKTFNDTLLFIGEEEETVPFRQLKTIEKVNGRYYQIILRCSLIEQDDLIVGITVLLVSIFFLIIVAFNLINYFGEKIWWRPFKKTLAELSDFNLSRTKKINLPVSDIDEFNELNVTLKNMTDKLISDYKRLKEFSENASHEMQTPLAIIRSKLDVMIQDKTLSEKQFGSIHTIYAAANRITKLNQSLNLLTKIENQEFREIENINLSQLLKGQLNNLNELIKSKKLNTQTNLQENIDVKINSFIAETLISNLLMNAVKHNYENGYISIELTQTKLIIKNTGKQPQISTDKLFERFKKDQQTSDSPGLGLSIVREICKLNNFHIDYNYHDGWHTIIVLFNI